jgi:hypothetical protein
MALTKPQFRELTKKLEHASKYDKSLSWMDLPGDLIFTAPKHVADPKCCYVVMGYNPGGSADEVTQKKLRCTIDTLELDDSNSNLSGWSDVMQNRFCTIKNIMTKSGFKGEPTGVNLFPYPSSGIKEFIATTRKRGCSLENMFTSMWPVHEYILQLANAKILLTLGYGLNNSVLALLKRHYKVDRFCFESPGVRAFEVPEPNSPLRYVIGLHHIAWRNVNESSLCACIREIAKSGVRADRSGGGRDGLGG